MTQTLSADVVSGAHHRVFTQGLGEAILGTREVTRDLLLGAAWVINLAVAEYIIRRRPGAASARHRNPVKPLT